MECVQHLIYILYYSFNNELHTLTSNKDKLFLNLEQCMCLALRLSL